jgi:hypothetical protein
MRRLLWVLLVLGMLVPGASAAEPRLLLVPLDSRPVNTYEVSLLADAAGLSVAMPPAGALDWYASRRSDFARLVDWLRAESRPGDTQVLHMNNLLAGGLIASRDPSLYAQLPARVAAVRALLKELPPGRRIAVQVLPRVEPTQFLPDGSPHPDYAWRQLLAEQTELRYRVARFGLPADREQLRQVEARIPEAVRRRAEALLGVNAQVVDALIAWTNEGLLSDLVVALDDAQPYSETKLILEQVRRRAPDLVAAGRLHLYFGADELGFQLVAREAAAAAGVEPVFALDWDRPPGATALKPYEAVPLGESVAQKVAFLGGRVAPGARSGFFLHTALWGEQPEAAVRQVGRMVAAMNDGYAATVVDVTGTGARDPQYAAALGERRLLGQVNYAGWNTASNSIGTGLAMAAVEQVQAGRGATARQVRALSAFRAVRLAYDVGYQSRKEELRRWVVDRGIDPVRLGAGRPLAEERLDASVAPTVQALVEESLPGACPGGVRLSFPWDRLFEVEVRCQ